MPPNKRKKPTGKKTTSSTQPPNKLKKDKQGKCFNDPVHGHVVLHPLLVKFIDTPQFQRLRQLKQLGGCYYVYPGATHNRFEHGIGACHLAGRLMRHIQQQEGLDKKIKPTDKDILCVEIAALCHDLGHGPFSHGFDSRFLKRFEDDWKKNNSNDEYKKLETHMKHEHRSQAMLLHLIEENKMEDKLRDYGIDMDVDVPFIKELIKPNIKKSGDDRVEYLFEDKNKKRKEKTYLFEVIANEVSGVDVDKWDYFARDCHNAGIRSSFDHNRFMAFMKVLKGPDEKLHLCVKDKEANNLYEMFHTRDALHRKVCKHKVTKEVEEMIYDAMHAANDHITFKGEGGKELKISETIKDMIAFQQLNDSVCDLILHSDPSLFPHDTTYKTDMEKAQNILRRLSKRDLYSYVDLRSVNSKESNVKGRMEEIIKSFKKTAAEAKIGEDDYFISESKFDYGMNEDDPVSKFLFYTKENPNECKNITKDTVSSMLPEIFLEYEVVVYCKNKNQEEKLRKCCEKWGKEKKKRRIRRK